MQKRILSIVCALVMISSLLMISSKDVWAFEGEKYDGSYLTMQDSSVGKTHPEVVTRGKYLMDGECSITKAGRGRIYVYASTTANITKVDCLSTVLYVDKFNENTQKWEQIDFWQVEDRDTYFLSTSKSLAVDRGYYYRVHATHVVGMDSDYPYEEATSATDGIWID